MAKDEFALPVHAKWTNTLRFCKDCDEIEIGLTAADGSTHRFAIDRESARHLAETLRDELAAATPDWAQCRLCKAQSASS